MYAPETQVAAAALGDPWASILVVAALFLLLSGLGLGLLWLMGARITPPEERRRMRSDPKKSGQRGGLIGFLVGLVIWFPVHAVFGDRMDRLEVGFWGSDNRLPFTDVALILLLVISVMVFSAWFRNRAIRRRLRGDRR